MKAWVVKEWCEPKDMHFEELPTPVPGPGQVLVKVEAAALNFLDTLMVKGRYQVKPPFPFTPGVEVAGTIEAAGAGSRFTPGQRVCGNVGTGGYATHALMPETSVLPVPDSLDFAEASALPIVYPTAHACLKEAGRMQPGDTVLVHAGAGGVGLAALQLAKIWGAGKIIATAGGPEKLAICKAHGADEAFDYSSEAWVDQVKAATNNNGADIIVDMVGGKVSESSLRVLAWHGRLIVVGFASGTIPNLAANRLLLKSASAIGVAWGETVRRNPSAGQAVFADLFDLLAAGKIKPVISQRYKLSQAPQAMLDLAARKTHGKVVLVPD